MRNWKEHEDLMDMNHGNTFYGTIANKIGNEGIQFLSEVLKYNTTLTELNLSSKLSKTSSQKRTKMPINVFYR